MIYLAGSTPAHSTIIATSSIMEHGKLFSAQVSAGTRVYYVDVVSDKKGQRFISLSEIPTYLFPGKGKRQRIFIHRENVDKVVKALAVAATHLKDDTER